MPWVLFLSVWLGQVVAFNMARREGEQVVRWIEDTKRESGNFPEKIQNQTRFGWHYRVDIDSPDGRYSLWAYYFPFSRVCISYVSSDGHWVDDRSY